MSQPLARAWRTAAVTASALVLVAACGSTASTPAPTAAPTAAPTPVPTAVAETPIRLLEVTSEGGFINPSAHIGILPVVVVDSDGRIYTQGAAADGSSPLIPIVSVRDTGAAGAAAIIAALKTAGLDKGGSIGGPVADSGTTVFSLTIDGADVVTRVGSAGPGGPGKPGGIGGDPAVAAALDVLARLQDPAETWGAAAAAPATVYAPIAYRLFIAPIDPTTMSLPYTPVAWPLPGTPDAFGKPGAADFGVTGLRSGMVTGADAASLAKALAGAQTGTSFSFGDAKTVWQAWIRPMLPDELGG